LIYTGEHDFRLKDLTQSRAVASMPIWGRYRMIDLMISCLVNTGIDNVGVITQKNYHSIMDHLGSGKEWDLDRKHEGLFILPPFAEHENSGVYRGIVDALRGVMGYIRHSTQKYCILMASHSLFKCSFDEAIEQHIKSGADVTAFTYTPKPEDIPEMWDASFVAVNEEGRITDIESAPTRPAYREAMMDVWIIERTLLEYLVEEASAHGITQLVQGILQPKLKELKVCAYHHKGYVARIDSVPLYYKANLDMLNEDLQREIFHENGLVYTTVKDEVPARYGSEGSAVNSLVTDGCVIEGTVENSVLFRGVRVGRGAVIRNSIIMKGTEIMDGAVLENVICDKDVLVKRDRKLIGQPSFLIVVPKGQVI